MSPLQGIPEPDRALDGPFEWSVEWSVERSVHPSHAGRSAERVRPGGQRAGSSTTVQASTAPLSKPLSTWIAAN